MLTVRPATEDDLVALVQLLEETDRFYGTVEFPPLDERIQLVRRVLFGGVAAALVVVAEEQAGGTIGASVDAGSSQLVGYASYSFLWPASDLSKSLYLKELFVSTDVRRQGVGQRLMAELFEIARTNMCSRVEWTTDRENPEAQAFYERLGYAAHRGKVFYRVGV